MNRTYPWFPANAVEELADTQLKLLTCDQYGLFERFRRQAWANDGLPADEKILEKLAQTFHCSRYKFRKFWPAVKNFFTEIDGALFYSQDLEYLKSKRSQEDMSREYGKLGAEVRRQKALQSQPSPEKISTSPPSFENKPPLLQHQEVDLEVTTAVSEIATSVVALSDLVDADAGTIVEASRRITGREYNTLTPKDQDQLWLKWANETPGTGQETAKKPPAKETSPRELVAKIFPDVTEKFMRSLRAKVQCVAPEVTDAELCEGLAATYKRGKQHSPGLWLDSLPAWFENKRRTAV